MVEQSSETSTNRTDERSNTNQSKERWATPIIRDDSGDPLGACIFLKTEDLIELGIDVSSQHRVYYSIKNEKTVEIFAANSETV